MRIDMTTREWHELIKPVLPHAGTDKDLPEFTVVRLEAIDDTLYAIASDRVTLAAERHQAGCIDQAFPPVHVRATEAAASLRLFLHSKDDDPPLHIIIDTVPVPVEVVGQQHEVSAWAVKIRRDDGTQLVMHDQRDRTRDPLAKWRTLLLQGFTREQGRALTGLDLQAARLGRWASAARPGERLCLYTGPEPGDPLLITCEKHFAGIWAIPQYLDAPGKTRDELPWLNELTLTGE